MVIDDLANRKHECDLLLDQNYTHDKKRYDHLLSLDSIKLLGPKYALLRKDFVTNKKIHKHQYSSIKKVFVFFGGSDLDNLTTIAIKALSQSKLKHLSVDVVIGLSNPHQLELKAEIDKHPNAKLHIQTDNMAELMAKADIALGAGGSTTWERMAVGLPSIVITLAENQVYSTRCLDQDGYLQWIGNVDKVHEETIFNVLLKTIQRPKQLQSQIQRGQELVDGMGTVSVTSFLLKSNK
jgi:UDP-2,4-diacetamido-2,4,6-trideoxy-beta-L-altropyranose hydrolase